MRALVTSCLVVMLGLVLAAPAAAQSAEDRRSAIQLTRRAEAAFNEGRFETAAELLEAAYAIYEDPTIVYNLARSRDELGQDEGAIEAYRRFLAQSPESDNAARARARVEILERRLDERRALEAAAARAEPAEGAEARATPEPTRGDEDEAPSITPWPWVIAGLGAAGLGAGIGIGAAAEARADEASTAPNHAAAYPLAQEAWDLETAANVTLIASGVVLFTGVLWGVLELALTD